MDPVRMVERVSKVYGPGDMLVMPKGFTGTWQMLGNYRELVAIEKTAYDAAFSPE